jgi:hypothetical protein
MGKEILISEPAYYSYLDEKHFFSWLESIKGVSSVVGSAMGLRVIFHDSGMDREGISDMMALLFRYSVNADSVRSIVGGQDMDWFESTNLYWNREGNLGCA